jgi:hypothetical protein
MVGYEPGAGRSWETFGLRGAAAILFAIAIFSLSPQAVAPLVFLFAAYVAGDGAFAILAGITSAAVATSPADADQGLRQPRCRGRRSRLAGGAGG